MIERGSVVIAAVLAMLALAAAADARPRPWVRIDHVRSQPETLGGQPGSLAIDFTEGGLAPGAESTYCWSAGATVTTLGREFRPVSHGGRWFATTRRIFAVAGNIPPPCSYTAVADASGTAHGHVTAVWPHLRLLPFLAQWSVSGIWVMDETHVSSSASGSRGTVYRTYCNGFRNQFIETGAVPDLADCSVSLPFDWSEGPHYEHPQTPPEVLAADQAATTDAHKMRDEIESCYARTQDYSACPAQISAPSSGLPVGSARGQVEITEARPPGAPDPVYTIVAHSRSGTDFTLGKWPRWDGAWYSPFLLSCNKPHRGLCGPDGPWYTY